MVAGGLYHSLMDVCVQFVSREDPIAVCIRPATKSTFKKYRKQTIVKSCLYRHLHRQLRGAGGEKQHDVFLASTVIALIAVPHLSRKASVGKDDLIVDIELSHYLVDGAIIKVSVVADQSAGDTVPTKIKHDDIIFIGFAEHRVHCLYDVISGRVGIRVAERLGIFVLLKNIVNGLRIVRTDPKVIARAGIIADSGTDNVRPCLHKTDQNREQYDKSQSSHRSYTIVPMSASFM